MAGEAQGGPKVELVIDVPALLAPIPGDKPTGANPRDDDSATSPYYDVRNVRGVANAAEKDWLNYELSADPRADEARGRAMQGWGQVQEKCEAILREKSKDLEVVEWLIEALVRVEDFPGLHAGLHLAAETIEKYWDDVNYSIDPDDPTAKGFNFDRLNRTLVAPIMRTPVTPPAGDRGPLPLAMLQKMQKDGSIGEAEAAARAGGRPFYQPLGVHIRGTLASWQRINKILNDKMGDDAPMLGPLTELLTDLEKMVKLVAGSLVDPPVGAEPTGAAEGDAAAATAEGAPGGAQANFARPGTFATREQALNMLVAVAKYFRENEPQSPVSYALDATIDRARMSLPDLLEELLPDVEARHRMLQIAGIRPPEPPPGADAKAKK